MTNRSVSPEYYPDLTQKITKYHELVDSYRWAQEEGATPEHLEVLDRQSRVAATWAIRSAQAYSCYTTYVTHGTTAGISNRTYFGHIFIGTPVGAEQAAVRLALLGAPCLTNEVARWNTALLDSSGKGSRLWARRRLLNKARRHLLTGRVVGVSNSYIVGMPVVSIEHAAGEDWRLVSTWRQDNIDAVTSALSALVKAEVSP